MKIVAVIGSPRKSENLKVIQTFENKLSALGDVTLSYIFCIEPIIFLFRRELFLPKFHLEDSKLLR